MSDPILANLKKVHDLSKERDAGANKRLDNIEKKIDEILTIIKTPKV